MTLTLDDIIIYPAGRKKPQKWVDSMYATIDTFARKEFPVWIDTKGSCVYISGYTYGCSSGATVPFSKLDAVVKDWLDVVYDWFKDNPDEDTVTYDNKGNPEGDSGYARISITLDGSLDPGFYITAKDADGVEVHRLAVLMDEATQMQTFPNNL